MCNCTNIGTADRAVRAVIGIVALVLAFTTLGVMAGAVWGIVAAVVGVVMLGTAALGMCPAYMPFKISTCKVSPR
jgi:membrane-bound ClpP family serine protease